MAQMATLSEKFGEKIGAFCSKQSYVNYAKI
jgi:hypothetical protein